MVLSGQFLIDSEASLKSTGTRMSDAPAMAGESHKGEGKVEKIDKDSVTISHGPIPSMQMGAMTMPFKAPKGGVPAEIKEGGMVSFEVMLTPKGEMALVSIQPKDAMMAPAQGMKK